MNNSKKLTYFSKLLVLLTLFLNGCGGGGSGGSASTNSSTTPSVNSTFISGTYNFQSTSNSKSKTTIQKASSVLSNDYDLFLFDVNGNSVIADTQVFTNGDFLIKIDNSNLNFDSSKYYIIKLVNKTNSISLSEIFQGVTKDRDSNHTLNLDSLIQVKAIERELVNQFLEQDPNFKPHLFALGEVSNSLDSNNPQILGKQVSSMVNGTQIKVNISDIKSLSNKTNSPLKIYKDISQNLIQFSSDLPANRGFDLVFNDLLECVNINISCKYPVVSTKVKNKIGGEQAIREGLESVFLTNQNSIINKQIEQYVNLDSDTKLQYLNSQTKLSSLLNTVNLNPESSFRLSLINESLNHVMKSYLEIPTNLDLNAYKRHRDYIKTLSDAIIPVSSLPLPNDLDDLLLTVRQATFENGYALSELTQMTKDGLLAEREIGENLAISFTSLALLSEFVNSSKKTDLETYALSSIDAIMKGIEQSASNPEQTKSALIQKISRLVGRDYSNSTVKQGIFTPPTLSLTPGFLSKIATSAIFKESIPISFFLTKAITNVTTNLKASFSIDNGVNFSPLSASNIKGESYKGDIFGLTAGPIPIVNIITWNSVKDIQKTSVSNLIIDLQVYDHFSIGEVVRFTFQQISNNNAPDLSDLAIISSYNDGSSNILSNNIPETFGPNQTATTVILDASLATEIDESDVGGLSYRWTQVSGPNISIHNSETKIANFLAPNVLSNSVVGIQLEVIDPKGAKSSRVFPLNILFKNNPPNIVIKVTSPNIPTITIPENIAAGDIVIGNTITLNLGDSTDIDNNPITYQWFSEDPTNFLTASIRSFAPFTTASFVVPSNPYYRSGGKTIPIRVDATDLPPSDQSLKVSRHLTFSVIFDDRLPSPVASPKNLQWLETAGAFELEALQSSDPDGEPVTHVWEYYPNESTPGISARYFAANPSPSSTNPNLINQIKTGIIRVNPFNVKPDESTLTLAFKLSVQSLEQLADGTITNNTTGQAVSTIVKVTVIAVDEQSPKIVSITPTVFTTPESLDGIHYQQVFLNASACLSDNALCDVNSNGSLALTYLWEQVQGNHNLTFTNPNSPQSSFLAPNVEPKVIDDLYKVKLTVNNPNANNNSSLPSSITSILNISISYVNFKPSNLSIGASTTLTNELIESSSVAPIVYLTANAIDSDQLSAIPQTLRYNWSQTSGTPLVSLQKINSSDVSFAPPNITKDTNFTFQVQVLDGIAPVDPQPRKASDALTKEISVFVRYVNTPPTLITSSEVIVNEGEPFTISSTGFDSETPFNSLIFKWKNSVGEIVSNTKIYTSSSAADVTRAQGSKSTLFTAEVCDLGNSSLTDVMCKQQTVIVRRVFKNNPPVANFTLQPNIISENNSSHSNDFLERSNLDGSFSYDSDFDSLRYLWSAQAESTNKHFPAVHGFIQSLSDSQPSAQFIPTDVCHDERYQLSLVVRDDLSNTPSQPDVQRITVKAVNRPPVIQNISFQNIGTRIIRMTAQVTDPDNNSVSLPCAQPFRYTWTILTPAKIPATLNQSTHGCLEKVGLICLNGNVQHVYNPLLPTTESVANFHLTGLSTNGAFTDTLHFRLQVNDASGSISPGTTSLNFEVKGGTFNSISKISKSSLQKTNKQFGGVLNIKGLASKFVKTNSPVHINASLLNPDLSTKQYHWRFLKAPLSDYLNLNLSSTSFYKFSPSIAGDYELSCEVTSSEGLHATSTINFTVIDMPKGDIQITPNLGDFTSNYQLVNVDYNLWDISDYSFSNHDSLTIDFVKDPNNYILIDAPLYESFYSKNKSLMATTIEFYQNTNHTHNSWFHQNQYFEKYASSVIRVSGLSENLIQHLPLKYSHASKVISISPSSFVILVDGELTYLNHHASHSILDSVDDFFVFENTVFATKQGDLLMLTFDNPTPVLIFKEASEIQNSNKFLVFRNHDKLYSLQLSDLAIRQISSNVDYFNINYSEDLITILQDKQLITLQLFDQKILSSINLSSLDFVDVISFNDKTLLIKDNLLINASNGSTLYQHSQSINDIFVTNNQLFIKDDTSIYMANSKSPLDSFQKVAIVPFNIKLIQDSVLISNKLYFLVDQSLYAFYDNQFHIIHDQKSIQDIYISKQKLHIVSNQKHYMFSDSNDWSYVNLSTPDSVNIAAIINEEIIIEKGDFDFFSLQQLYPNLSFTLQDQTDLYFNKTRIDVSEDSKSFKVLLK
ncbi:MAG: hypothetical protein KC646_15845 [Candidatus Cloacimonetes bacterium]|nr:hypothetical protein [Candidatus Cloacimonadota bacterium]